WLERAQRRALEGWWARLHMPGDALSTSEATITHAESTAHGTYTLLAANGQVTVHQLERMGDELLEVAEDLASATVDHTPEVHTTHARLLARVRAEAQGPQRRRERVLAARLLLWYAPKRVETARALDTLEQMPEHTDTQTVLALARRAPYDEHTERRARALIHGALQDEDAHIRARCVDLLDAWPLRERCDALCEVILTPAPPDTRRRALTHAARLDNTLLRARPAVVLIGEALRVPLHVPESRPHEHAAVARAAKTLLREDPAIEVRLLAATYVDDLATNPAPPLERILTTPGDPEALQKLCAARLARQERPSEPLLRWLKRRGVQRLSSEECAHIIYPLATHRDWPNAQRFLLTQGPELRAEGALRWLLYDYILHHRLDTPETARALTRIATSPSSSTTTGK
ncbi:MAG: hypothetical protein AAGI01_17590, partial [Myxococcota bacterium]